MALNPNSTLVDPIQINLTAGSDSGVALLIGSGSPDGSADPYLSAGKGSLFVRIDATDDYGALYQKVDDDGADDDWAHFVADKDEDDLDLEGHVTMDADKRVYFRDTDVSIYSDAACQLNIAAPGASAASKFTVVGAASFNSTACFHGAASFDSTVTYGGAIVQSSTACFTGAASFDSTVDVAGTASLAAVAVGGATAGTYIGGILVGSGALVFGALAASAASATSLDITGLTQDHKIFISASDISGCLNVASISCSPGGGVLKVGVVNAASEAYAGGTETIAYLAIAACM
jgi:hypothetical protein